MVHTGVAGIERQAFKRAAGLCSEWEALLAVTCVSAGEGCSWPAQQQLV